MASHIEMQRLADDPAGVRSLASYLLTVNEVGWTDWEVEFLGSMATRSNPEPLSIRQREILFELRDDAKTYEKIDGFSVKTLMRDCWLARMDLSEDDEEFIDHLKQKDETALKRRPLFRLLHCARQVGLIDRFVNVR